MPAGEIHDHGPHTWKEMYVLVPVQMGGANPSFDDPLHLGRELATYGLLRHSTGDHPGDEGCVPRHEPPLGGY